MTHIFIAVEFARDSIIFQQHSVNGCRK